MVGIGVSCGECDGIAVTAQILLVKIGDSPPSLTSDEILSSVQSPARPSHTEFIAFTHVRLLGGGRVKAHPAFAFVNPHDQSATVQLSFRGHGGWRPAAQDSEIVIPARSRKRAFLGELFSRVIPNINITPPRLVDLAGTATATSEQPIVLGALDVLLPEGKLVSGFVQPLKPTSALGNNSDKKIGTLPKGGISTIVW